MTEQAERANTSTDLVLDRAEGTSFRVALSRAGDPTAPVVVVVPAMGMRARYYRDLAAALAEAGLHAAVTELRGHEAAGGREPGRSYDFGYADMVEDLDATLDAVRTELPQAPVVLLGHSLGGQLAVMYAGLHPDRVAGIALVASSTPHFRHWGPKLLVAGVGFPLTARVVGHFPGQQVGFAGREARGVMRDWGRIALTGSFGTAERGLAGIAVPVLAVSVEGDTLGPERAVDALGAKLPRSTVTRQHISGDGLDHFRWARRPESVVPLVLEWARTSGLL